jgi:hypothetical protein
MMAHNQTHPMTTALLPSLTNRLASFFCAESASSATPLDYTEPAKSPDMMGTVCKVHGCARFLGEAPLVPRDGADDTFDAIKQRYFPHSWTAIASWERPGLFKRTGRTRLVVVRYCPECREAASEWLSDLRLAAHEPSDEEQMAVASLM